MEMTANTPAQQAAIEYYLDAHRDETAADAVAHYRKNNHSAWVGQAMTTEASVATSALATLGPGPARDLAAPGAVQLPAVASEVAPYVPPPLKMDGFDGVTTDHQAYGKLKICQDKSEDSDGVPILGQEGLGITLGQWFDSATLEGFDSVTIAVLRLKPHREWDFSEKFKSAERRLAIADAASKYGVMVPSDHEGAICYSDDCVTPVKQEGFGTVASSCYGCKAAQWHDRKRECNDILDLWVATFDEHGNLAGESFMRLTGRSVKAGNKLISKLKPYRFAKKATWQYTIRATTKEVKGERGTYYAADFVGKLVEVKDEATLTVLKALSARAFTKN